MSNATFNFVPEPKQNDQKDQPRKRKKSPDSLLIIVASIAVVAIVAVIVLAMLLLSKGKSDVSAESTVSEEIVTVQPVDSEKVETTKTELSFIPKPSLKKVEPKKSLKEINIERVKSFPTLMGDTEEERLARAKRVRQGFEKGGYYGVLFWRLGEYIHNKDCPLYARGDGLGTQPHNCIGMCCPICGGTRYEPEEMSDQEIKDFVVREEKEYLERKEAWERFEKRRAQEEEKKEKEKAEYQKWLNKKIEEEKGTDSGFFD